MAQRWDLLGVAAGFGLAQGGSPLNTRCTIPGGRRCQTESESMTLVTDQAGLFTWISSSYIFRLRSVFVLDLRPWYTRDECWTQQTAQFKAVKRFHKKKKES